MGTRAIVHVKEDKKTLVTLYRQYDGYPSGLGKDILDALDGGKARITNGYGGKDKAPAVFNGIGCMAAYLIGKLKGDSIGNVYIMPPNQSDCGEGYIYTLSGKQPDFDSRDKNGGITLKVEAVYSKKVLFKGLLSEFKPETMGDAE